MGPSDAVVLMVQAYGLGLSLGVIAMLAKGTR